MDLIADRGRRVSVDELNTTQLLRHARKQAHQRNLDDMLPLALGIGWHVTSVFEIELDFLPWLSQL